MKFINEKHGILLGYHIFIDSIPGNKCGITIHHTAPYTADVSILLPEGNRDNWYALFRSAIVRIQDGKNWTLRFYKDNICQHISMAELDRFDKQFTQYPIVLYGGEDENGKANSFSYQQRQRYLARTKSGA